MKMLIIIKNDEVRNELKQFGEKNKISDDEYNRRFFEILKLLPQYCSKLNSTQNPNERRKILDEIYAIIKYGIGSKIGGFRRTTMDGDIISVQRHEGIALSPHKDLEMLYYFEYINFGFGVEKLINNINGKIGIRINQNNENMRLESENQGPRK